MMDKRAQQLWCVSLCPASCFTGTAVRHTMCMMHKHAVNPKCMHQHASARLHHRCSSSCIPLLWVELLLGHLSRLSQTRSVGACHVCNGVGASALHHIYG